MADIYAQLIYVLFALRIDGDEQDVSLCDSGICVYMKVRETDGKRYGLPSVLMVTQGNPGRHALDPWDIIQSLNVYIVHVSDVNVVVVFVTPTSRQC